MNTSKPSKHDNVRAIVHRTSGSTHGPITRLMSPGDLGEHLKPFVFLDLFSVRAGAQRPSFGILPHSGIATLTFLIEGQVRYGDTTGKEGVLPTDGVEWMRAGNGVWHYGQPADDSPMLGFQLWVALPASHELVMGYYSVHTSRAALAQGEAEIERIGAQLRREGRLGQARLPA